MGDFQAYWEPEWGEGSAPPPSDQGWELPTTDQAEHDQFPAEPDEPPPPTSEGDYYQPSAVGSIIRESLRYEVRPALWSSSRPWDERDLPRRPWIVPGYIMRGAVSLLAGAGSAGKSSVMKAWAVAGALGTSYSRFTPDGRIRVLTYNVEDDLFEERRRISATLRQFEASPAEVMEHIRIVGPDQIGTLVERGEDGRIRVTRAMAELIELIEEFQPDVVMLDPLVELHTAEENDNTGLRGVIAHFRALAVRYQIGVVIAHHTRKGATIPGDPDAIRGAGAIVGAARVAFTVCTMTEEEAKKFGLPLDTRRHFFRIDGAKSNYAPIEGAEWFERHAFELDNGELVAAAVPWSPPQDVITEFDMDAIRNAVAQGYSSSEPFTEHWKSPRSINHLCAKFGITTREGQRRVIEGLRGAGFVVQKYATPDHKKADGLRSPEGAPQAVEWQD